MEVTSHRSLAPLTWSSPSCSERSSQETWSSYASSSWNTSLQSWGVKFYDIWLKKVPLKACFLMWIICLGKVLTLDRIQKFGTHLANICCLCNNDQESARHLLMSCAFANQIWSCFLGSIRPDITNLGGFIKRIAKRLLNPIGQRLHGSLMAVVLWEIWTERNNRIFNNISHRPEYVGQRVIERLWDWEWEYLALKDRPEILFAKVLSYDSTSISFAPSGGYWRQLRKICVMELLSVKRVQSFQSIREEEVENFVQSISLVAGSPVNITEKIYSLLNDITSRAAFGNKCKEKETFLFCMHEMVKLAGGFHLPDLYPSLTFLQDITGMKSRLEKTHHKLLEDIINEHRMSRRSSNGDNMEEDLVDVLLRVQEDDELELPLKNNNIKAIILDMFSGGTETSSTIILWAMSEMMRNPSVMEKVQFEVRRVLNGMGQINSSDVDELRYLKLVIKEILRLHPPLPLLLPRQTSQVCELDGYVIPKGSRVIVNAWAIGTDPIYWSDPERFEPERFQDHSIDYKGNDFQYIPFGSGRRICPGISFGIAKVELPLAQLLYHFDWKLPDGIKSEDLDMTELFGVTVGRKSMLYSIPTLHLPL